MQTSPLPCTKVRAYLTAKYRDRFSIPPRLLEEVVGAVFKDLGYDVVVTAYSEDGRIDVILTDAAALQTGVQVKRTKNAIEVEQILAFTGALVIGGYTQGIFVTTSRFRSGAHGAASMSALRGYPIELVDGRRFYDALKITQVKSFDKYKTRRPWRPLPQVSYLQVQGPTPRLMRCVDDEGEGTMTDVETGLPFEEL